MTETTEFQAPDGSCADFLKTAATIAPPRGDAFPNIIMIAVPAKICGPLAVHAATGHRGFVITHIASGLCLSNVVQADGLDADETEEVARAMAGSLTESEWSEIISSRLAGEPRKDLAKRVQKAAFAALPDNAF